MTQAKTPSDSRITLNRLMETNDANIHGNVHGGIIMKLVDEAGALAAIRHSASSVVTVQIDSMTFRNPIFIGSLVTFTAELTYVGRTSMEVKVEVHAENPMTGKGITTNTAYLVYVAIDENGQSKAVPSLTAENTAQERRMQQAQERQIFRKGQRQTEVEIEALEDSYE